MVRPLAPIIAAALLLGGCTGTQSSTNDFEGEAKDVADQIERIQSAGETGNAATICDDVLAKELRDRIAATGTSCEQELEHAIQDADDFELEVEDVRITGDTATAKVKGRDGGEDQVRDFAFVREGGSWRATRLG